jgi:hypothetical protein
MHGGEDEPWHVECGIAPFACLDELILGDAIVDLNIVRPDAGSKSRTGSMIAQALDCGSLST